MTKLASIIPVYNRKNITLSCLEHLTKNELILSLNLNHIDHTIVVIDDGSTDDTTDAICNLFPDVIVLRGNGKLWWTGAVNKGIRYCLENDFSLIHIMNDDIEFEPNFLHELVAVSCSDCIVGSVTLYSNKKNVIFKAGMLKTGLPHPRLIDLYKNITYADVCPQTTRTVAALSGRSLLIPRKIFLDIGLFDDKKFPHGFADMEFCFRAGENGYKSFVNLKSKIYSTPGDDKNLIQVLKSCNRLEFLKTFFNLKYSWHIPTMFYFNIVYRNKLLGFVGFSYHALIMLKWLFIKLFFPKQITNKIIANHAWEKGRNINQDKHLYER